MADPLIAKLTNNVVHLTQLVMKQQGFIFALVDYARSQPNYDPARFAACLRENQARFEPKTGETNEALLALLRAFEGPIQ